MNLKDLTKEIALGEDSARQFKADVRNAESLASEMAAFANMSGGTIFIGVADDGAVPGLSQKDVARINQSSAMPPANWCVVRWWCKQKMSLWRTAASSSF